MGYSVLEAEAMTTMYASPPGQSSGYTPIYLVLGRPGTDVMIKKIYLP
jgi:hypothetical protein